MALPYTGIDALGLYLTTAGGAHATLTPAESLGGFRSPREVRGLECLIDGTMASVIIENIGGDIEEGVAEIAGSDEDYLSFTPAGGAIGDAVEVLDGAIRSVISDGLDSFVRVRRDGQTDLGDYIQLDCRKPFNGVIGFDDVSAADSSAGVDHYRAAMLHAHGPDDVTAIKIYVTPLGTQRVSGAAQLGATGGGTIGTATTNGFADWPAQGWVKISTSGGTLREIVYYTSRTSTVLTVPADGRDRLGTTAAAGASTDLIIPVPGIRLAIEAPDADGLIQMIADQHTAPTGVTWSVAHTAATGLTIATLESGRNYGLRIHREIPPGATGTYKQESGITIEHVDGTVKFYGLYRVAQSSLAKYSLYAGVDAFPSFASPVATSATLPFDYALSAPVSGTRTHRLVTRYTDVYGVETFNTFPVNITLDSAGEEVGADVSAPYDITLSDISSGYARLTAKYATGIDATDADQFKYYVTTNGTNPTTGGTPVTVDMSVGNGLSSLRYLNVEIGPYDYGTDLRVLVTTYRTDDSEQSINTTPAQLTIGTVGLAAPALLSAGYDGAYSVNGGWLIEEKIEYLNAPTNTVYLRCTTGMTELWSDGEVIFRGVYGGDGFYVLYIPEAYTLINDTVSGAGAATAFQVVSVDEIYICVGGVRKVKIDRTAMEITAETFVADGAAVDNDAPVSEPTLAHDDYTTVQIYDPAAGVWGSLLSVDSAGTLNARVIRQQTT